MYAVVGVTHDEYTSDIGIKTVKLAKSYDKAVCVANTMLLDLSRNDWEDDCPFKEISNTQILGNKEEFLKYMCPINGYSTYLATEKTQCAYYGNGWSRFEVYVQIIDLAQNK